MIDLPASVLVAAFVNNLLLSQTLGGEHIRAESGTRRLLALGGMLSCCSVPAVLLGWILLGPGAEVGHSIGVFILIVGCAAIGIAVPRVVQLTLPRWSGSIGTIAPLLLVNSVLVGVAATTVMPDTYLLHRYATALGAIAGLTLVLVLLDAMRDRLRAAPIPDAFRGLPIELLTLALMSLAFMGLSGIGQHG